ncbi:MAG: FtsX-like permease family protein [Polyangiales bacterium]
MNLASIAVRNVWRNRFRALMTVLGVAVAVMAFVMLRTVVTATNVAVTYAAQDRVGTRHKVSFVLQLPRRYIDTVRAVPGVRTATWANWFGAKEPNHPNDFFATMAVDPDSFFDVYNEMAVAPDALARWREDRRGAIVGDVLARKMGWRVGQRVVLRGTIYPGDWEFNIAGIYNATRRSVDRSQFLFHYRYLNESIPVGRRDQIGWMIARIDNPSQAASISRAIDAAFDVQDVQTVSMSERAMNLSFMGMLSGMFTAINVISLVILGILALLLGNTIAMGVRERTMEYGVLRALGFLPKHVAAFILSEAAALGAFAGLAGVALSYPVVQQGLGRWIEENQGATFPYFRIEPETAAVAFALAVALALAAAALPAWRASRLTVTDALRRLD